MLDRNGEIIKIGDKVKRVDGGEHGGMKEGDVGYVCENPGTGITTSIYISKIGEPSDIKPLTLK